jgi:predicted kinase
MGREVHLDTFFSELSKGTSLIVDRMNFNVGQRKRYLLAAKERGYKTKIVNIKVPYGVCRERIAKRQGHPTINTEADARDALNRFFREYQAPKYYEADVVETITNP